MGWISVSFEVAASEADAMVDALLAAGALSVDVSDAAAGTQAEQPIFGEPGTGDELVWTRQLLSALFEATADVPAALRRAAVAAGLESVPDCALAPVSDQDWVRATQQQFTPIRISPTLWIVPSWSEVPDAAAINLRLDPGLAFGTGSHPTTSQCLRWLESNLHGGESVLDYGCGSGILAIAAKRLMAGQVVAVDIDTGALESSRANASTNGVEIHVAAPDQVPPGPYDVVVANILSNPLRVLAPLLAGFTRSGGRIALAGILTEQADSVGAAYSPWFEIGPFSEHDGWTCLAGVRKPL
jgi:ribosomal protein L11 methyltransferase